LQLYKDKVFCKNLYLIKCNSFFFCSRKKKDKNIEHDEFPLRGFITFSGCSSVITGSMLRGYTGRRYYYYHCVTPCESRYPSGNLNEKIEALIAKVYFPEE
tara:strand:- start:363 stop:665 length:303 start_codon:yes stop_codon:yes gene_type:complete